VLLLGLYWKGMSRAGAVAAMVSGLALALYYIVTNHPWVQIRLGWSPADTMWLGIEPVSAAVFAVPLGLLAGWVFSKALPSQKLL